MYLIFKYIFISNVELLGLRVQGREPNHCLKDGKVSFFFYTEPDKTAVKLEKERKKKKKVNQEVSTLCTVGIG